jgi:membrane-associated phospholipid phosphatase
VFLFVTCSHLYAQGDTSRHSADAIVLSDANMAFNDAGTIFGAPLHFSGTDWLVTGSIVGTTAILFSIDESARSLAHRNLSRVNDDLSDAGEQYGRPIYGIALSGGLYLGGLAFNNREVRGTGLMIVESLAFSGAITMVLKIVTGRSRPYLEEGSTRFRGMQFDNDRQSFPSGHSTVAFAISSTIAQRLHNTFASIGLYSLATLTAVSRVYSDQHWFSDSFFGAAIGTAVGIAVVNLHEHPEDHFSLRFTPSVDGIRVELRF